jgi:hypothetical protein
LKYESKGKHSLGRPRNRWNSNVILETKHSVLYLEREENMRFELLTAVMMTILFWVVTPCGLVDRYKRFG